MHTATLSAIHDAWEQLLKSRGLDFVEGPAAIVEAEGEAYLISWKVKGQRPYWLIVTYAMTGGLHQGVTRFGIDGHGFEFSIRVPAKNKERSPSDKVCAMLTNLIGTARRAPEHVHSGFAVVNSVKRANGRHLADLVLLCDDRDLPEVQTPNGRVAFLAAQFITREELELCMKGNPDYFSAVLWEKTTPHGLSNFSRTPIITPQIEAACIEADESGLKDATDF
ncbi:MAG: suppressor of fused domain protein, partial [Sutterella wadsworthensis]